MPSATHASAPCAATCARRSACKGLAPPSLFTNALATALVITGSPLDATAILRGARQGGGEGARPCAAA
eukprot:3044544-Prymnesium_polylepis.1